MTSLLLYLYKLCDDALGNTAASIRFEMMPHKKSHGSNSTGSNGNLEEKEES